MKSRKQYSKTSIRIPFFLLVLSITGCDQDDFVISSPDPQIDFTVSKTNSEDDYVSRASISQFREQLSRWSRYGEEVWLIRELYYDVVLENDEVLTFELYIRLNETNESLLILEEDGNWAYKSFANEKKRLSQFGEMRIVINSSNVFFCSEACENIQINEVKKSLFEGEERTYLIFSFHGDATGWYDPEGKYMEVYEISNGSFSGLIEFGKEAYSYTDS